MSYSSPQGPFGPPGPYGGYPVVHTQVVTQPYRSSTAHLVIVWILTALTLGYTLPWAIAATRNKTNTAAIALINVFLGWSLVGWIVALVMSLLNEPAPAVYVHTTSVPGPYPAYGPPAAQAPPAPAPPALPTPAPTWSEPPYGYPVEPTQVLPPYENHPYENHPNENNPWQRPRDDTDYR